MDVSSQLHMSEECKRKQEDRDAMPCIKRRRSINVGQERTSIMTQDLSTSDHLSPPSDSLLPTIQSDSDSLPDNFRRSGLPRRFMFYEKGEWKDYPNHVLIAITACFKAHKTCLRFSIASEAHRTTASSYAVNFVYMLQLNMNTGYVRSVAWTDDHGICFFPSNCIEGSYSDHQGQVLVSSDGCRGVLVSEFEHQCKNSIPQRQTSSSSSSSSSSNEDADSSTLSDGATQSFAYGLRDRLVKLDEAHDKDFESVKEKFVRGLSLLAKHTTITGIYKVLHDTTSLGSTAWLEAFKEQESLTKEIRGGDANVRLGWHGTSKEGVKNILLHGFRSTRVKNDASSYAVSVFLAPEDYSRVSIIYSDIDENDEQHIILCKVVLGKTEQVHPGSHQLHPSSEDYDTAVDELEHPKRYIVWSTHMNTRILPEFVVSFKLSPPVHALVVAALGGKKLRKCLLPPILNVQASCPKGHHACDKATSCKSPSSPWISFAELFSMLRPKLNPKDMFVLQQQYINFRARKLLRHVFVKKIRSMVGDDILRDCLARKNNS